MMPLVLSVQHYTRVRLFRHSLNRDPKSSDLNITSLLQEMYGFNPTLISVNWYDGVQVPFALRLEAFAKTRHSWTGNACSVPHSLTVPSGCYVDISAKCMTWRLSIYLYHLFLRNLFPKRLLCHACEFSAKIAKSFYN
jgi:hypothetical protein